MCMELPTHYLDGYDESLADSGRRILHFGHANGYPPRAYRPLFERLSSHFHILAMNMRPLWPGTDPMALKDWQPLADDLQAYLDERRLTNIIGAGHSMGATTTLRLALRQPERFNALVLIDPVLFPPWMINFWNLSYHLGLAYYVHPLVRTAMHRHNTFESREVMFANYRQKTIFSHLSDEALMAYVDSLACDCSDGGVQLCYPPAWEARIYITSLRADLKLWRALHLLKPPLLIIRGAKTNTFWNATARLVKRRLPSAQIHTVTGATHLVPLEKPQEVSNLVSEFLRGCNV